MDVARAEAQSFERELFAAPEGAAPLTEVRGFHCSDCLVALGLGRAKARPYNFGAQPHQADDRLGGVGLERDEARPTTPGYSRLVFADLRCAREACGFLPAGRFAGGDQRWVFRSTRDSMISTPSDSRSFFCSEAQGFRQRPIR